ncbi:MAG: HD domain-containing protein [Candidatus Micrarchaeia archaeon]
MLHSEAFILAGIAGSAMLAWAMKDIFLPKKETFSKNKKQKQVIVLETIAVIWSKRKEAIINIEELSLLWRSLKLDGSNNREEFNFYNEIITNFFREHIEGKLFFIGNTKKVILNLLTLLDTEGNVSSVVSGQQDTEGKISQETIKKLYNISLIEHTINVAEEIINLIPYGPMTPKGIIAALGHDIGKIPKYRQQYYAMGDHPFISVSALETIPDFKNLVYADDVLKAVRDHHLKPKDKLTEYLKEADQRARRKELNKVNSIIITEDYIGKTGDTHVDEHNQTNQRIYQTENQTLSNVSNENNQTFTKPLVNQTQTIKRNQTLSNEKVEEKTKENSQSIWGLSKCSEQYLDENFDIDEENINLFISAEVSHEERKHQEEKGAQKSKYKYERIQDEGKKSELDIFMTVDNSDETNKEKEKSNKPKVVPIDWLNLDEFLQRISSKINKLDDRKTWQAFSMPNGVVYVLPDLVFNTLKEIADEMGRLDLNLVSSDKAVKRDYIYSVLTKVKEEKDGIETSLIKEGYFSAPFVVKLKDGSVLSRSLYIPFRAQEAFGKSVGYFEMMKQGRLLDIKEVTIPSDS